MTAARNLYLPFGLMARADEPLEVKVKFCNVTMHGTI